MNNIKTKQFITFINLAKSLETATNFWPDWDYNTDTYSSSTPINTSEVKKIEKTFHLTKDKFLKENIGF